MAFAVGGCQQLSTYPPVEVTAKMQRPAAEPVPTIIAESVRYAREHYGVSPEAPLNLPQGVPAPVYDKVFAHLEGGRPMQFPGEKAVHITEIRTRAMNAQVDMVYPKSDGFNQFVTLTLERSVLESWRVKSERKWAIPNMASPRPNYVAPPPPTMQAKGG